MSDRPRQIVAWGCLLWFLLAIPSDLNNIRLGLTHPDPGADWRLSLGLSLKTLMTVGAILGLLADTTMGYCFLLGACLQITLVRVGDVQGVGDAWWLYPGQLTLPVLDLAFRAGCFWFLARRWKRLLGEGVSS